MTKNATKELTIKGKYDIVKPSEMVVMAKLLQSHIKKQNLSVIIVGKQYAMVEGWQFAGGLTGMIAKITSVEELSKGTEKKWRADAEIIRLHDDKLMGTGIAICSNIENKKKGFDEYAILSMAQTRAIGKAYRNTIGWVMKMAGYEATPGEEVVKMGEEIKNTPASAIKSTQQAKTATTATKPTYSSYIRLKDKLTKLGAKTLPEAIAKFNEITGETIKELPRKEDAAKSKLFQLLNSPTTKK